MMVILVLVGLGGYVAYPRVAPVFLANPYLNGVILAVFVVGILACFWQVFQVRSSVAWIVAFVRNDAEQFGLKPPSLMVSLATLLGNRKARMQIGSTSAVTILDSVGTRMDEARDITRYIINLLIFLGLLGTFYGLATTIPGVVDTIRSLNPKEGESSVAVFTNLMNGLESQLAGMGTAFASSLLGLAGSLVVGLLELFAGHGQNRFYRELEDWLSTITRVGFLSGEGEGSVDQTAVAGVLDHMVEQIDSLQGLFVDAEAGRKETEEKLDILARALGSLTERLETTVEATEALNRVADGQELLIEHLGQMADGDSGDSESRMRLRSIDVQLLKVLEEIATGRQESLSVIHQDLKKLTSVFERLEVTVD